MLSILTQWIVKLIRALQDNTGATNANTIRVMEQSELLEKTAHKLSANTEQVEQNTAAIADNTKSTNALLPILQAIADSLHPVPVHMELQFDQGEPGMPGQELDNQTIPCSAIETDKDGNPVTLNPANVVWAIDNLPDGTPIATLTQNADGSASFKAVKVGGPVNVSCSDNGQTPPLVGTNTLEVTASVKTPTSMALVFGDPQAATS